MEATMHAIILAAGRGNRLAELNPDRRPKCLLEFGGKSLLERQLETLFRLGISKATLVVGYEADRIIDHVGLLTTRPDVAFVYNPAFNHGSVLSLLAAQEPMTRGNTVLVMDADLLFHPEILKRLIASPIQNCYLLDKNFIHGEEPVKIAVRQGQMVDLRKSLSAGLEFDYLGESVGFFKFNGGIAAQIIQACAAYEAEGLLGAPHEEALRDVLLASPSVFSFEDISDLPWLEVDFPEDVERGLQSVLPTIRQDLAGY
jgi:choline kinase